MTTISTRRQILVNTDPQRRCYDGCHASSEMQWTRWEVIEDTRWMSPDTDVNARLKFWRDLNAYSITVGGYHSEYRIDIAVS